MKLQKPKVYNSFELLIFGSFILHIQKQYSILQKRLRFGYLLKDINIVIKNYCINL
jgi:hypothetical protein